MSTVAVRPHFEHHGGKGDCRLPVPADCTRSGELGRLAHAASRVISGGPRRFVLDLIALRTMNCQLLSTIIFLGRECIRHGVALVLENVPAEFDAWVSSHRLTEPLGQLVQCTAARP